MGWMVGGGSCCKHSMKMLIFKGGQESGLRTGGMITTKEQQLGRTRGGGLGPCVGLIIPRHGIAGPKR